MIPDSLVNNWAGQDHNSGIKIFISGLGNNSRRLRV